MEVKLLTEQILKWNDVDELITSKSRRQHDLPSHPPSDTLKQIDLGSKMAEIKTMKLAELVTSSIADPLTQFGKRPRFHKPKDSLAGEKGLKQELLPALPTKTVPQMIPSVTNHIDAIQIDWTEDTASKKKYHHETEQKRKAFQAEPRVKHLPDHRVSETRIIKTQPKPSNGPEVVYTPQHVIKDGFQTLQNTHSTMSTSCHVTKRNLVFPPPESTSILFHCRQGDLFRKREALVEDKVVTPPTLQPQTSQPDRMDSVADLSFYFPNPQQQQIELPPSSWILRLLSPIPVHWVVCDPNVAR
jgi:hypothetical protein